MPEPATLEVQSCEAVYPSNCVVLQREEARIVYAGPFRHMPRHFTNDEIVLLNPVDIATIRKLQQAEKVKVTGE